MTDLKDSQFTLLPDGQVAFQSDPTNPLPGIPRARLGKGERPLHPRLFVLSEADVPEGFETRAAQWLETRIATVLEPLDLLEKATNLSPALQGVAAGLLSGFGAAARVDLLPVLADLTPEDRQILRARKIRSGSLHVYFQDLNKPVAVRLRALLWSLWHDALLPAPLPYDGAVSAPCPAGVPELFTNASYWLSVGYPLCARRLVRIDMLDRLVGAVYDGASKGTFRATHQMAEWLGVPIDTLYEVLESLGHRRIEEKPTLSETGPESGAAVPGSVPEARVEGPSLPDTLPAQELSGGAEPAPVSGAEAVSVPSETVKPSAKKPELALFRLARAYGSAHRPGTPARGPALARQDAEGGLPQSASPAGPSDKTHGPRKARRKSEQPDESRSARPKSGKSESSRDSMQAKKRPFDLSRREARGRDGESRARAERPERVICAQAKVNPEDSPFAVLRQLMKPSASEGEVVSDKAADGG